MTTGFIDTPHWPWLTVALAVVLLGDALMSLRPPDFIRDCLDGVRFPRDWWWTLVVIKLVAVGGLVAGLSYPGVGVAAGPGSRSVSPIPDSASAARGSQSATAGP